MTILVALGVPSLPLAACRGRWDLFDLTAEVDCDRYVIEATTRICEACAELPRCGDWLEGLPLRDKPFGVTAGRLRKPRRERAA